MCLMLDQFLWGHLSRVCDVSCYIRKQCRPWILHLGLHLFQNSIGGGGECSGSVVECLAQEGKAAGKSLTGITALWSLSKTHLS